jgi:hypothetical protein
MDPRTIELEPANDLEAIMIQVAAGVRDEADFLAALFAADVFVPQHAGRRGEDPVVPGTEIAVRVVEVRGHDVVPAFSSVEQLEKTLPDVSYARLPVPVLQRRVGEGVGIVINPFGDLTRLLVAGEVAALPNPAPPERAAVPAPARLAIGDPAEEASELYAAVSAFCGDEPAIRAAYRALAGREDDPAGSQLVIGLLADPGAPADALMREAEQRLRPPEGVMFALTVLDPDALGAIGRFMVERTAPIYERAAG